MTLPYPPPWQDKATLCAHICVCPDTVDTWVKEKILPPPRKKRGKWMWKWAEVDAKLSEDDGEAVTAERVRNATQQEQASRD